jgi:hypothetical protein
MINFDWNKYVFLYDTVRLIVFRFSSHKKRTEFRYTYKQENNLSQIGSIQAKQLVIGEFRCLIRVD